MQLSIKSFYLELVDVCECSNIEKIKKIVEEYKEKGELNPLPAKEIRIKYHLKLNEVQVSKESLISYKSNKYSVPKKYIGLKVGLTIEKYELHVYYNIF